MIDIENRQVVDAEWMTLEGMFKEIPEDAREKLNGSGFEEVGTGIFVSEQDAYKYALERISRDEELKQELVKWFYSDDWIKED